MQYAPVMPTIIFLPAIQAPRERRILWPAWRWSNVPPRATTSNNGGRGDGVAKVSFGLSGVWCCGCSMWNGELLLGSVVGRKDWRIAVMDDGSGVAIVSRKDYLKWMKHEIWSSPPATRKTMSKGFPMSSGMLRSMPRSRTSISKSSLSRSWATFVAWTYT